jgi:hypothetical protein
MYRTCIIFVVICGYYPLMRRVIGMDVPYGYTELWIGVFAVCRGGSI